MVVCNFVRCELHTKAAGYCPKIAWIVPSLRGKASVKLVGAGVGMYLNKY